MTDDTHDQLIKAMIAYSNNNTEFQLYGYTTSSVRARDALLILHKLSKVRREEILEQRIKMHGHKGKGIDPIEPTERRQRKIQRQNQKRQNDQGEDDT
jgi:hypothetical protein